MPTTINFPLSVQPVKRSLITDLDPLDARIGFGILMLWAIIMLSIGAAAHFGAQSPEYGAFELLALS
jgi:hypothetical protein